MWKIIQIITKTQILTVHFIIIYHSYKLSLSGTALCSVYIVSISNRENTEMLFRKMILTCRIIPKLRIRISSAQLSFGLFCTLDRYKSSKLFVYIGWGLFSWRSFCFGWRAPNIIEIFRGGVHSLWQIIGGECVRCVLLLFPW